MTSQNDKNVDATNDVRKLLAQCIKIAKQGGGKRLTREHIAVLPREMWEPLQRCLGRDQQIALFDEFKTWHMNGKLHKHYKCENGVYHGAARVYHRSDPLNLNVGGGNIRAILHYDSGFFNGSFKMYNINGALMITGHHSHGIRCGTWEWYSPTGRLRRRTEFGGDVARCGTGPWVQ